MLLIVVIMFAAYFVYLVMAGAGLGLALEVLGRAVLTGLGLGVLMAAVPYYIWPELGQLVFMYYGVFGCLTGLAYESLRKSREFAIPKSSTFEVVCLNVLALAFGGPPDTVPTFEPFVAAAYVILVNPLGFLPPEFGWLKTVFSLWPSALALLVASWGGQHGRLLRLVLMWWVQLVCITWVFPASIGALVGALEGSRYHYVDAVFAAVGLVRVILALGTLKIALLGTRRPEDFEVPEGTAAAADFRRGLVEKMLVLPLPAWVYATGSLGIYLLANAAQHFLEPDVAITAGFFTILAVSGVFAALHAPDWRASWTVASHPVLAIILLAVGLPILREMPLLPRYVRVYAPPPMQRVQPAAQEQPQGVRPTPGPTSVRGVNLNLSRLRSDTALECEVEPGEGADLRLKCASESWLFSSLSHPPRVPVPVEVSEPLAKYSLRFLDFETRCVEYAVRVPQSEPLGVLLVIFLKSASIPGQAGWAVGPEARCRHLSVAVFPDTPQGEPTILFASSEEEARGNPYRLKRVFTPQRHAMAEAEIEAAEDPDASSGAPH